MCYLRLIAYIGPLSLSEWVFIRDPCLIQLELMQHEPHTESQQRSAYSITSVIICAIHQMRCDCRGSGIEWNREEQRGLIPGGLKSNHKTNMIIEI